MRRTHTHSGMVTVQFTGSDANGTPFNATVLGNIEISHMNTVHHNSTILHSEEVKLTIESMDWVIFTKCLINICSVIIHIMVLLLIQCRPSLRSPAFDELFFSVNLADIAATLLRVITKYAPVIILRDHTGIVNLDKETFPLATVTNATEWYVNYVIICSALAFACDRAVMAVSFHSYTWFCNRFFKWILVFLSWLLPFAWVLPMFDECCRSSYIENRVELLEMQKAEADTAYDSIDMIFETLFYVPVLCTLNTFTLLMLYNKWKSLMAKIELKHVQRKAGKIPTVNGIAALCEDKKCRYIETAVEENGVDEDWYYEKLRERLELELGFAMISNIDQLVDFFVILFYSLYWASYMKFLDINYKWPVEVYYMLFEFGTLMTPYLLFIFCKNVRQEFFAFTKRVCHCGLEDVFE